MKFVGVGERQRVDVEKEAAVDFGGLRRQHRSRQFKIASGQVSLCRPGECPRSLFFPLFSKNIVLLLFACKLSIAKKSHMFFSVVR